MADTVDHVKVGFIFASSADVPLGCSDMYTYSSSLLFVVRALDGADGMFYAPEVQGGAVNIRPRC